MEHIIEREISDLMPERFKLYSLSVISDRALPDVRDGLKPIQRKILFSMNNQKMFHNTQRKKCARIVGDVIARYSEHGDASAYEALVNMSQPWKMRYPLIDFEGKGYCRLKTKSQKS